MQLKSLLFDSKRLQDSRFVRHVAVVASGSAGAQLITVVFAPLVSRIYSPEAFGALGAFIALLVVLSPVTALAYPMAIVLPRSDADALGLVRLSLIISALVVVLAGIVVLFTGNNLAGLLGIQEVGGLIYFVPLSMLFMSWVDISQQWLIRLKRFHVSARMTVLHSLALNVAKAGAGWFYPLGSVLVGVTVAGHFLQALLLGGGAYRVTGRDVAEARSSLCVLARKYYDFPFYRAPQIFINAASQNMPLLLLAVFFGSASAGLYTLSRMVIGMPSMLLGKSVGDVFYPRITDAMREGMNPARLIVRTTGALFLTGIVPFGLVFLFGPELFSLVFGQEWTVAGNYARWLSFFFFFNFINKPAIAAVPVLGIQKELFFYEIFSTGAKALAIIVGFSYFNSDITAVALFSVTGALAYVFMITWIYIKAAQS